MMETHDIAPQAYLLPAMQERNRDLWNRYAAARESIGINIGSGAALAPGFLNCDLAPQYDDVFALDATQAFPFDSGSIDVVFSEHMIEHITYDAGQVMLRECRRVLRPGGTIRIATPSIEFLIGLFRPDCSMRERDYIEWAQRTLTPTAPAALPAFVFNTFVRSWGHVFIYDRASLRLALEGTGFCDVEEVPISHSRHAMLQNRESVHRMPPGYLDLESMVFEARAPAAVLG